MSTELYYKQEGDSPLLCATTTYDHWTNVSEKLHLITSEDVTVQNKSDYIPSAVETANDVNQIHGVDKDQLIQEAALCLLPVYAKLRNDSEAGGRLVRTLTIFRACRLLDYTFIANNALLALTAMG